MDKKLKEYLSLIGEKVFHKQLTFNTKTIAIEEQLIPTKIIGIVNIKNVWNYIVSLKNNKIEVKIPCDKIIKEKEKNIIEKQFLETFVDDDYSSLYDEDEE